MSGPDDTQALVKAASEGVTEGAVRAALEPFVAPIAESGQIVTDLIRFQRWKMQWRILEKAKAFLSDRGLKIQAVPLKVLVPLLEAASLEDEENEEMLDRWAALLANAAAGALGAPVMPSFPHILSQLEPYDALMLDRLARHTRRIGERVLREEFRISPTDAPGRGVFQIHLDNLERLRLCIVTTPPDQPLRRLVGERVLAELGAPTDAKSKRNFTRLTSKQRGLQISDLGRSFHAACSPPRA